MENLCNFGDLSFNIVEDKLSSSNDIFWETNKLSEMKNVKFSVEEDLGDYNGIESLCSNFGFFQDDPSQEDELLLSTDQQKYHQQPYQDYESFDNLHFDMVQFDEQQCPTKNPPLCDTKKDQQFYQTPPIEILKNYGKGFKRLSPDEGKIHHPENESKLSTEDIMKIAGTRFIQSSSLSESASGLILDHPFGFSFSGLSDEEKEDVSLAESLLACAEKVGYQQYERARKLLLQIESLSSKTGNPVKRVVHYFAEALRQRIDKETGRVSVSTNNMKKMGPLFDPQEVTKDLNPALVAFFQDLPFCKISMFTCVQTLIENVTNAKKIHVIDLEIRKGLQWTILMQALQSRNKCPVELLKITAIVTGNIETLKNIVEDTGKRLKDFARYLNIPFLFDTIIVSDLLHLREDLFKIDSEETVAVYSQFALQSKIQQSDQLETIMRVVRTINPKVMVVAEIEANHNSKSFVNRFIEALFYFSAFFDCFEDCMKDDENRMILESKYFGHGIRNMVAEEGAERKSRNVKIDVWRAFFARFGMVETELSMMSLYQAELMAKRFPCGISCTFDMNGHCLLVGWKGTPINSVSVWKFI
ncbi:DELLA protein RGL2 [Medicago truncatula]|uniref:GRAS family transcription factor n=1 Tax=Medicago truncatula TaxID=3880 RepID=A2Q2X9_MEDTR|nr:DELLA protein RGL2 [Medicago truncatula]ABN07979.1 GRAS transcription factor [Medicago truncatula]AES65006.1 GRAS family transcription factor [Medicago truncatula]QYE52155.1 MIG2 [Medicago truncatula]